jgi:cyanophycin synthetase
VALRDGQVLLFDGSAEQPVGNGRGAALVTRLGAHVVLPAVAGAWALGLMPALITAAFETFDLSLPAPPAASATGG